MYKFALTEGGGNVVEGYEYDVYGQQTVFASDFTTVVGTNSTVGMPYTYTGQCCDPETGLLYYKNRYFSAGLGRFLSRDPLGYSDSLNMYEYTRSRPTFATDSLGLSELADQAWIQTLVERIALLEALRRTIYDEIAVLNQPPHRGTPEAARRIAQLMERLKYNAGLLQRARESLAAARAALAQAARGGLPRAGGAASAWAPPLLTLGWVVLMY